MYPGWAKVGGVCLPQGHPVLPPTPLYTAGRGSALVLGSGPPDTGQALPFYLNLVQARASHQMSSSLMSLWGPRRLSLATPQPVIRLISPHEWVTQRAAPAQGWGGGCDMGHTVCSPFPWQSPCLEGVTPLRGRSPSSHLPHPASWLPHTPHTLSGPGWARSPAPRGRGSQNSSSWHASLCLGAL